MTDHDTTPTIDGSAPTTVPNWFDRGPTPLGTMAWTELERRAPILMVPIGSCEQHGPHLPVRTDTIIAVALVERAVAGVREHGIDAVGTPAIEFSASGEHQGFPGTLSIGTDAMATMLIELVRSADWSGGVVLVNGHGGNLDAVSSALAVATVEGRRPLAWWPPRSAPMSDLHAGHLETSMLLALDASLVRADQTAIDPVTLDTTGVRRLRTEGVAAVSPSGVLGDPRRASAEAGIALLEVWVQNLIASVRQWLTEDRGRTAVPGR